MSGAIRGVVVAYDAGHGVLLLQHRSFRTLPELVRQYAASQEDCGFWFASFTWSVISDSDKRRIEQLLSANQGRRRRNQRRRFRSIHAVLLGRYVTCKVAKDPKWRASWISVDFENEKVQLPDRRVHTERYGSNKGSHRPSVREKIVQRVAQRGPNNLRRPWGGVRGEASAN